MTEADIIVAAARERAETQARAQGHVFWTHADLEAASECFAELAVAHDITQRKEASNGQAQSPAA